MTAHTLNRHLDSIQATARAVEEHARRVNYYVRDCDTLDNALKAGKSGFVVLFDSDETKEPEIHAIGRESANVKVEKGNAAQTWECSYEALDPEGLARRIAVGKAVSEERQPSPAISIEGKKQLTGDALRAKQISDAAREKTIRAEGIARTASYAAQIKAEAEKLWSKKF
ncbi:hypothetical protein AMST5_00977 [freshwater sediment metagenome]|uniref:Uncharacterized protein n=1 Tax=freshwater sediment metagenome TaxID=556182 RepID=A0AA48M193_9ZZZZ